MRESNYFGLAVASLLALAVYFYAVNMTIRNTVERQELENEVTMLSAETSALEYEYIAKKHDINIELAYEYGLKEVKNPHYVSRTQANGLTLNTPIR